MKFMLTSVLLSLSFLAQAENKVVLAVSLSPAGSFQAVSQKPKGILVKTGESFTSDKISVSIESFKTGMDLRDEHFAKHLNSATHNKAVLTDLKAQNGKGTGVLEVNGVKKPVSISYTEKASDVIAKFKVKASDFKLSKAEYLGVGVQDDIDVEAVLSYVKK